MTAAVGKKSYPAKIAVLIILAILAVISVFVCTAMGTVEFTVSEVWGALTRDDDSMARLLIWNLRFPRVLTGGLVGVCLSLSGCILQGVMRNTMASPSTIGVTSGASFVGYMTLVAFPAYAYLLPVGSIVGAFATTMLIYALAYQKGVSPVKMILSGMAVSALFGASGFLVGGLNGTEWKSLYSMLPYAAAGILICMFLPARMNILMLGDETANALGLRTERFRFLLIVVSSLLSGAAISVAGLISFVGLVVPHIARLLVGSDYKYLFPASTLLGFVLVSVCDTIGRVIMPPGEVPVSVILAFIGAPFFLYLLRTRQKD